MNEFRRDLMAYVAMATLAATTSRVATADEAEADSAPADSSQLEVITITATKRAERLQDVPVAVTALTAQTLERANVRELGDLVKMSPGLVVTYGSQPGNFAISMRGIGTFSNGIAVESDVAVVIDDVPLGYQAEAFSDLTDVDRVEVLRGPQSTLFGKSAIAGVLNITTAAPTAEWTGKATGYFTNDDEKRAGLTVSGPLSDTVRVRLTVNDSDYKGNITNLTTGQKIDGSSGLTARAKLEWRPNDNLTVTLSPRFYRNESTCCASVTTSLTPGLYYQGITQLPASYVLRGIPIGPDNHYIRMDYRPGGGDSRNIGGTARVDYHFGDTSILKDHTLSSITSADHWRLLDYQDQDGNDTHFLLYYPLTSPSGIDGGAYQYGYFHTNSTTQEFRLTSPGDQRLRYVTGLWYARNALDRYLWKGPVLNVNEYWTSSDNTNYAAFGNGTLDLTDKLSLTGGVRYNIQKINYRFSNYTFNRNFGDVNQDRSTTGKAGLEYKWTPDIMTYVTWSTGYKGQAYDLISTLQAKEAGTFPIPRETATNYEVGIKSSLFDRRVYFNLDVFDADYHGFQTSVTQSQPDGTFLTALASVGHMRTRGVEMDAAAKPFSNLTLNASFAYTDATIIDFPNGPCYWNNKSPGCNGPNPTLPAPRNVPNTADLAGQPLNNVPKFKYNLGGEYDQPLPDMPFSAFAGFAYTWQSAVNFSLNQDPITVQRAYGIANFSLGINDYHDHYKLSLFVNNAFDKRYSVGTGDITSGFLLAGGTARPGSSGTSAMLARDAFRYFGGRIDVQF
jgi:iron complex outermembrane receptor protein